MRKNYYLLIVFVGLMILSLPSKNIKAQVVEQGSMVIDLYYGWPNVFTSTLKTDFTSSADENITVTGMGMGPIGGRFEYLITDRIGIGIEANHSTSTVKVTSSSTDYVYKVSVPRYRAFSRINFHFTNSDSFDAYGTFGVGYAGFFYTYETKYRYPSCVDKTLGDLAPVAFRIGVGGRYFFADNIGASFEMGLGGGEVYNVGLAIRF